MSVFNDLMFLHGHIADVELLRRLASPSEHDVTSPTPERSTQRARHSWRAR